MADTAVKDTNPAKGPTGDPARGEGRARAAARGLVRLALGFLVLEALMRLSAGDARWWNAWAWFAAMVVPMGVFLAWLVRHAPAFLEKRLRTDERRPVQRGVLLGGLVAYVGTFVVPGLDHRYGWSSMPWPVVALGFVVLWAGYAAMAWAMLENRFASRVVELQEGQRVIDTGPYARVRHPMYASALVFFVGTSLALGSWWTLIAVAGVGATFVVRILDEERLLEEGLPGYLAYGERVRWRMLPGVW